MTQQRPHEKILYCICYPFLGVFTQICWNVNRQKKEGGREDRGRKGNIRDGDVILGVRCVKQGRPQMSKAGRVYFLSREEIVQSSLHDPVMLSVVCYSKTVTLSDLVSSFVRF